ERDDGQRHQRNERCIAEGARSGKTAIGAEPPQRIHRKGSQRRHPLPKFSTLRGAMALFLGGNHLENLSCPVSFKQGAGAIISAPGSRDWPPLTASCRMIKAARSEEDDAADGGKARAHHGRRQ